MARRWDDCVPCGGRVCRFGVGSGGRVYVLRLVSNITSLPIRTNADWTYRAILAQLSYSAGGSGFPGGNGSMMIEVVVCLAIMHNATRSNAYMRSRSSISLPLA